jgi:hypothetical protein
VHAQAVARAQDLCRRPIREHDTAGSPYVNLDLGTDSVWSPGERVEVVLEFARESTGKGKKPAITYT